MRFTGFKETKKKSSGKKRAKGALSTSFVPLFGEDSDGCVVVRDEAEIVDVKDHFNVFTQEKMQTDAIAPQKVANLAEEETKENIPP